MARPERFELPTTKFVAWYSIQLSYGRAERAIMRMRVRIVNASCGPEINTLESALSRPVSATASGAHVYRAPRSRYSSASDCPRSRPRRDARVAEGAPLLREYRVYSLIEGSNPSLSARYARAPKGAFCVSGGERGSGEKPNGFDRLAGTPICTAQQPAGREPRMARVHPSPKTLRRQDSSEADATMRVGELSNLAQRVREVQMVKTLAHVIHGPGVLEPKTGNCPELCGAGQ